MKFKHLALATLSIFLVLAMSPLVNAQSLIITHKALDNTIASNEVAKFELTIQNAGPHPQEIALVSPGHKWDVSFSDYLFSLGMGETKTVDVRVAPPIDTPIGSYGIQIYARDQENPLFADSETLFVDITESIGLPNYGLTIDIDAPDRAKQGETVEIIASITNNRNSDLRYVTAKLESELFPPRERLIRTLISKEKTPAFEFSVPIEGEADEYEITLGIYEDATLLAEGTKTISLSRARVTDIATSESVGSFLFDRKYQISVTNTGDNEVTDNAKIVVSKLKNYIVSTEPLAAEVARDGSVEYIWTFTLDPGETFTAQYTFNYNLLVIFLLVAIAAIGTVYRKRFTGAIVEKDVTLTREEGEKFIKIKLAIRNNTSKPIEKVVVTDYLRVPFKLIHKFGTLEPDAVKRGENKVILKWKLGGLGPREERYLSYGAKSTLGIIGRIILPAARLKYTAKNAIYTSKSNRVALEGKPEKTKTQPQKIKVSKVEEET